MVIRLDINTSNEIETKPIEPIYEYYMKRNGWLYFRNDFHKFSIQSVDAINKFKECKYGDKFIIEMT